MNIEEGLIRQCIQGDKKAQIRLYDQCYSFMMSICIRYCKDRQEAGARLNLAFLKVLQHLQDYDYSGSFKAWVSKITLRSIIDEFRSQQKHYHTHIYQGQIVQEPMWTNGDSGHWSGQIDIEKVMTMIQQLSPMDRQVFNLFAIDGYTHKEIGTMLNISEGTSKWHVHEARKKLKENLSKEYKTALK
ncbi:MAG TPA: RNA polymerase sigma factor [Saprospiraceae bacterium]|nr:RNA polymerase sigma factor [Saprospiraceae bacterium]